MKEKEKIDIKSVEELFGGTNRYLIPYHQRFYVWSKTQWEQLLYDLENLGNKSHFFGSIILKNNGKKDGINIFEIIDGQQRITTWIILLIVIRDYFNKHNDTYFTDEWIKNLETKWFKTKDENEWCLDVVNVYGSWLQDMFSGDIDDLDFIESNEMYDIKLMGCYNFWKSYFEDLSDEKRKVFVNFVSEGAKKFFVAVLEIDNKENSHVYFESLNSKKMQISTIELIKVNYLKRFSRDKSVAIYEKLWKKLNSSFIGKEWEKKFIFFLRYFLISEKSLHINKDKNLYIEYKNYFDKNEENLERILEKALIYSKYYKYIICDDKHPNEEIRSLFEEMYYKGKGKQDWNYISLVLKLYADFQNEIINEKIFIPLLKTIRNFTSRNWLLDLKEREPVVFAKFYNECFKNQDLKKIDDEKYEKLFYQYAIKGIVFNSKELESSSFQQGLKVKQYIKQFDQSKLLYVLYSVQNFKSNSLWEKRVYEILKTIPLIEKDSNVYRSIIGDSKVDNSYNMEDIVQVLNAMGNKILVSNFNNKDKILESKYKGMYSNQKKVPSFAHFDSHMIFDYIKSEFYSYKEHMLNIQNSNSLDLDLINKRTENLVTLIDEILNNKKNEKGNLVKLWVKN